MNPEVSVIVPLHRPTVEFRQCVAEVCALPGDRHELIVVSDTHVDGLPENARLLVTGSAGDSSPAEKRDAALAQVRGAVCAFLDDDAYPRRDWIERALERFADPTIAAVGGPGVTPPGAGWRERAGGAFYESPLGSGSLRYRFQPVNGVRDVDDFPAYNFFVRTDALRDIGGWASRFYGGEDTKVCLTLIEAGHRIVYDPDVVVFHHRRRLFRPHMRQVGNVGRHRGYFVRAFPATSSRPIYFAPSAALVAGAAAVLWAVRRPRRIKMLGGLAAGLWAAISWSALRAGRDPAVAALLPAALAAGHTAYGVGFARGLATRSIDSM